jgi:tetratricopeptide (TPR) repeat protein
LFLSGFVAHAESTNVDYALGVQQYQKSDWEGAITNFSKSIQAGYDLYDSYSYRAYSRAELGDKYGAVEDCNKIIKLYPGAAGFYWCAQIELVVTNYDAAMADFEVGLRIDSKYAPEDLAIELSSICYARGMRNMYTNALESAVTNLSHAIYIMPTNGMAYAQRGFLKILKSRFESAIEDEYLAIKFEPRTAYGYQMRAFARCETEDKSGALEDCKTALSLYAKQELRWQTNNVGKEVPKELKNVSLLVQGLQNYIGGNYETAAALWRQLLDGEDELPEPWKAYIEKWIERAKAKDH